MSLFENIQVTNSGLNLQSKAQIGKALNFKFIKIGDGKIGSTPISTITDLKNYKLTIDLNKFRVLTDGQAVVGGVLTNTNVTEGFYWREIGLYAEDPDTGLDTLYAYGNCGDLAEFIPAVSSNTIIEKVVNIIILISNMENVSASIDNSLVFATQQDLDELKTDIEEINLALSELHKIAQTGDYSDLSDVPIRNDIPYVYLYDTQDDNLIENGIYRITNLSINGVIDTKFNNSIIHRYVATNGSIFVSLIAGSNMNLNNYIYYAASYTDGKWTIESKKVAVKTSELTNDSNFISSQIVTAFWSGTQAQYDAIETKDGTTLYLITEEE